MPIDPASMSGTGSKAPWKPPPARQYILALLLLSAFGCWAKPEGSNAPPRQNQTEPGKAQETPSQVRLPAVAGLFYPAEGPALSKMLDRLLDQAPTHYVPHLKALICPHAGYEYSGRTAAIAYKCLAGREFETVLLLAPSHYAAFDGASIPRVDAYRTPLGLVLLSEQARSLATVKPFVLEPTCLVQRPGWWRQAPKPAPENGQDTPDTWEHAAEVQVPFLQKSLQKFRLLPVVCGEVAPEQLARVLAERLDNRTLVVASSDLSHFHPYETAGKLDRQCVKAICDLDIERMQSQEACGKTPVLALMHLARLKGWKAQFLDYRNSGDVAPDKDRVVGYSAIAFSAPAAESFSPSEKRFMLGLARRTLVSVVTNGSLPQVTDKDLGTKLSEKKACFVTLTRNGELRGCIGHILPQEPLYQALLDNARSAALRDPRFPPVRAAEVPQLKIEVSVLTVPEPLAFTSPEDLLSKLQPYEDGVLLQVGGRGATFLPQVWAQIPNKAEFLNHLSAKAGCEPAAWRGKETSVSIYHVECFEETEEAPPIR